MTNSAKPVDTRVIDGEKVRTYDLPTDGDTVFNLDTSENGYTVEWCVSDEYQAADQEEFLREIGESSQTYALYRMYSESLTENSNSRLRSGLSDLGNRPTEATIGDAHGRATFDEVTSVDGFPQDCTYLRVEADSFDIEWESWDYYNRIMLSAPDNDPDLVSEAFTKFVENYPSSVLGDAQGRGLDQVRHMIESDITRKSLDDF
jgi:hypothetical protein